MSPVHLCALCDWSRPGSSAAILDPYCPRCGGLLQAADHLPAPEAPPAAVPANAPADEAFAGVRVVLLVLFIAVSAMAGARNGGPFVAVGAAGLALMVGVPMAFAGPPRR